MLPNKALNRSLNVAIPFLLTFLLLLLRVLARVSPTDFRRTPPLDQSPLNLRALYIKTVEGIYASILRLIRRIQKTLAPKDNSNCECCQETARLTAQRYIPLPQLHEAADKDCPRCGTVLQSILKFSDQWQGTPHSDVCVERRSITEGGNEHLVRVRWPETTPRDPWHPTRGFNWLNLNILYGDRILDPNYSVRGQEWGVSVPLDARSDSSFRFVQTQIDLCLSSHKLCNINSQTPFLPTRLIDVRPENISSRASEGDVQLVETAALADSSARYIALSYCWGEKHQRIKAIPKLTSKTRARRLNYIPWEELVKTYEDSITITRRLGVKYIWIDALCIIQDDSEDFAAQAGQMASIYGKAHVIISATRAPTGDIGIFHDRVGPLQVSYTDTRGQQAVAHVRESGFHSDFEKNDQLNFKRTPVFSRAWCFQERLLAKRVVHYAEHEIVWECNEQLRCECGSRNDGHRGISFKTRQARRLALSTPSSPSSLPPALASASASTSNRTTLSTPEASSRSPPQGTGQKRRQRQQKRNQPVPDLGLEQELSFRHSFWHEGIHTYTTRSLSYESDRLPALSGFAHELYHPRMGRYCAGLWENSLPPSLLWHVWRPQLESKSGKVHRSAGGGRNDKQPPTWSWPSIKGTVLLHHANQRKIVLARVLEIHCLPATTSDPFGQVQSGAYIVLEAPVVVVRVVGHGVAEHVSGMRPCVHLRREQLPEQNEPDGDGNVENERTDSESGMGSKGGNNRKGGARGEAAAAVAAAEKQEKEKHECVTDLDLEPETAWNVGAEPVAEMGGNINEDHVPLHSRMLCVIIEMACLDTDGDAPKCLVLRTRKKRRQIRGDNDICAGGEEKGDAEETAKEEGEGEDKSYCRIGTFDCPRTWVHHAERRVVKIF